MKKRAPWFILLILIFCIAYSYRGETLMTIGGFTFGNKKTIFYSLPIATFAYTKAAEMNSPFPFSNYQLGRIAFIKGDFETALTYFEKELAFYPHTTKTYYMLGLTLGYMHREKEGIEMFSRYIENTTDTWASYNDKAWLQFRIGDVDGALATIEEVVQVQPYNPWIANTYGVLLMNKKRYKEAEDSFLKGRERLETMTEEDWGQAYPGNDPRIYTTGLSAMRQSYEDNLELVRERMKSE